MGGREQEYEGTDRNPDKNKCNVNHLKSSSKIASPFETPATKQISMDTSNQTQLRPSEPDRFKALSTRHQERNTTEAHATIEIRCIMCQ